MGGINKKTVIIAVVAAAAVLWAYNKYPQVRSVLGAGQAA